MGDKEILSLVRSVAEEILVHTEFELRISSAEFFNDGEDTYKTTEVDWVDDTSEPIYFDAAWWGDDAGGRLKTEDEDGDDWETYHRVSGLYMKEIGEQAGALCVDLRSNTVKRHIAKDQTPGTYMEPHDIYQEMK